MGKRRTKTDYSIDETADVETFMRTFRAFIERAQQLTDPKVHLADTVLQAHLGADATAQPIVSETFTPWDHINVTG
jgi:hypothetical protein